MKSSVIIGTRGSELALWQAHHVKAKLESLGQSCTLHIIRTKGDNIQNLSFDKIEGKGFFTKEIEEALLRQEIDLAVHSHKDLETNSPPGLVIGAVSERADPRELLLVRPESHDASKPYGLKNNAIVGTSSARRKSQILHLRPDVTCADIRGNVPTRIQKLRDAKFDAILLAKAGVDRLNIDLSGLISLAIEPEVFVPAPAQGVLALQCRENDTDVLNLLSRISHEETREVIAMERTILNRLQGGCQLPLGAYATKKGLLFTVHVAHAQAWNAPLTTFSESGTDAQKLVDSILARINA